MAGLNSQTILLIAISVGLFAAVLYGGVERRRTLFVLSIIAPSSVFLFGFGRSFMTADQIGRPWYLLAFFATSFYSFVCCAIVYIFEQIRSKLARRR